MFFAVLILAWLFLLVLTFRFPNSPKPDRLFFFLLWLGVSAVLAYQFAVEVLHYNPNPTRLELARRVTDSKLIDLSQIANGVYDLDNIHRIDTDWEDEGADDDEARNEWVAFYRYDIAGATTENPQGPFGGAIYDPDHCRPPAIQSYELVPASYDYLGQDAVGIRVEDIVSEQKDEPTGTRIPPLRPEVIINGYTHGVVTDLNIFRKEGQQTGCPDRVQWQQSHPGEPLPSSLVYRNIGTFRGDYLIERAGARVTVVNRAGFERSQFTVRKVYEPREGSYYKPGTQMLLDPVRLTLAFGPGQPDEIPNVYYPEKAVLAFYLNLGKDRDKQRIAQGYLSEEAQGEFDIRTDTFGLSAANDSVAQARAKLAGVLVWQISYEPDAAAEQRHETRRVTATVVGVSDNGQIDYAHPCEVTWEVIGVSNLAAPPYGTEWRLNDYQSTCAPPK